jgi:cytoskeletal protein CcmA (bactofilin family)
MADGGTISAGTVIRGRVRADGDLEVLGHVEGSIEAGGELTIAEGAMVKGDGGDLAAERVVVGGAVNASLRGGELVLLESSARVVGDVSAPTIGIRSGALVRGRVETAAAPSRAAAVSKAAASKVTSREPAARAAAPRAEGDKASRVAAKPAARKSSSRVDKKKAPTPVMPKASGRARKKTAASKKSAPRKKAAKRRSR